MHATRISPLNPGPRHATGEYDNIIIATALIRSGTLFAIPKSPPFQAKSPAEGEYMD